MSWLIDGQQRVTTLSRTMHGDEGIEVVFHPELREFRLANAATRSDTNWVRVSELWDDERYRELRRNLDGSRRADKREACFDTVRRILDYEIPVVRMVDHSFDNAVRAFKRINTLGVRLKKEDIESADVAARHTGFIADEVIPFLSSLRQARLQSDKCDASVPSVRIRRRTGWKEPNSASRIGEAPSSVRLENHREGYASGNRTD